MKKILTILALSLICALCAVGLTACGGGVEFKINFVVDGKIYATVDTSGNETIKMPKNPTKNDYSFDGWFWDKDIWAKPFTANSLLDAPLSSDMSVYAKWIFTGEFIPPEPEENEIEEYFEKKQDGTYYGKVYNTTTNFDFTDKIDYDGEYFVCTDQACTRPLADNKTSLTLGDNVFYVLYDNGQKTTATVRRRLIYTVNFNAVGGTAVSSLSVEEDKKAMIPSKNPMRVGYTFSKWDYDFKEPITGNTTISAIWNANTDTPYKIEYYLQNLEDDNYTLQENDTENLTGTTDTTITATKTYEHFTIKSNTASGNIKADGSTVLKVYYTRDKYTVKISAANVGVTLNKTYNSSYKYGYIIPETVATVKPLLGYDNKCVWYIDNEFCGDDYTLPSFTVCKSVNYIAACPVKDEMVNFEFSSTLTTCKITGIKDKSISEITIPNYITNISCDMVTNCENVKNINYLGTVNEWVQIEGLKNLSNKDRQLYIDGRTLPRTVILDEGIKYIRSYAFYGWSWSLTSITIPSSVINIENNAFASYSSLNIYYTGTVNQWASQISGIKNLMTEISGKKLYINNQILTNAVFEGIKIIQPYAFYGLRDLKTVTISKSVKTIGFKAFGNSGLTSAIFQNPKDWYWCSYGYITRKNYKLEDGLSHPGSAADQLRDSMEDTWYQD